MFTVLIWEFLNHVQYRPKKNSAVNQLAARLRVGSSKPVPQGRGRGAVPQGRGHEAATRKPEPVSRKRRPGPARRKTGRRRPRAAASSMASCGPERAGGDAHLPARQIYTRRKGGRALEQPTFVDVVAANKGLALQFLVVAPSKVPRRYVRWGKRTGGPFEHRPHKTREVQLPSSPHRCGRRDTTAQANSENSARATPDSFQNHLRHSQRRLRKRTGFDVGGIGRRVRVRERKSSHSAQRDIRVPVEPNGDSHCRWRLHRGAQRPSGRMRRRARCTGTGGPSQS